MKKSPSKARLGVVAMRSGGKIVRLEVHGHAGFAPAGKDIVCAAVSALVMAGAHGVARRGGARARVHDDPAGAYVLDVPDGGGARAQAVLESILDALRAIARSYPGRLSVRTRARGRVRTHVQGRASGSRKR